MLISDIPSHPKAALDTSIPLSSASFPVKMSTSDAAATTITVEDAGADVRGKTPAAAAPAAPAVAARRARLPILFRKNKGGGGWKRAVAFLDFIIRLCAIAATLTAAIVMGTSHETLPFFTEDFQFHANFADLPAMIFFVVANGIVAGYLALSLPFAIVSIIRPQATCPRLLLFMFDTVMLALLTAAASSATSIVYLAHHGDSEANWVAICLRFHGFCQRISGAVVSSFVAVVFFMLLVVMSALIMRKH